MRSVWDLARSERGDLEFSHGGFEACKRAGMEPIAVEYEGDDLAEYVIDCNVTRRNMSTGARAMATALVLDADGRREGGRWQYGKARESFGPKDDNSVAVAVSKAGVVLDWLPDVAEQVVAGTMALDAVRGLHGRHIHAAPNCGCNTHALSTA